MNQVPEVRWLGAAGMALGVALVLGGGALAIRSRRARALGSIGAMAAVVAGLVVAAAAGVSLEACAARPDAVPCQVLVGSIAFTGAGIGIAGAAAGIALQRASSDAFRRPERR